MMLDNHVFHTVEVMKKRDALVKGKAEQIERHHVDAISDDDFGEVVEHEKLKEGAFLVEGFMTFCSG